MKSEFTLGRTAGTAPTAPQFVARFSSTRRGARLARLAAAQQLADWGWEPTDELSRNVTLIVAELAANAITHGHVRGRDFELRLALAPGAALRIEVSDARGERCPAPLFALFSDAESGRGLVLVDALADRWGVMPRPPSGKTVWCELDLSESGS